MLQVGLPVVVLPLTWAPSAGMTHLFTPPVLTELHAVPQRFQSNQFGETLEET